MEMYILTIIGNPISHSKSPLIHKRFAEEFNLHVNYDRIEAALDQFKHAVVKFKEQGGNGMNITMPFKQEAFKLADQLTQRAEMAGAVNTFVFKKNGDILGDNTDGVGLVTDIVKNLNFKIAEKNILILGAGGAVRGILHPLLSESPKKIVIANRTIEKACKLAREFEKLGDVFGCGFEDLTDQEFDLVIDGTGFSSSLLLPNTLKLSANSLCYDLKYENDSAFLVWAREHGAEKSVNGIGMLVEQAAESFYLWTNKKPKTENLIAILQSNL